eukprot:2088055-Lingulodinium_polyedra.AAC.1
MLWGRLANATWENQTEETTQQHQIPRNLQAGGLARPRPTNVANIVCWSGFPQFVCVGRTHV